jgi:hypothetical protein
MEKVNLWPVLVAAVSSFFLGGLWYSRLLFGRLWNRESGQKPQNGHPAKVFALSFLFALIAAGAFAYWLGADPSLKNALIQGVLAGACFVGASFGINYQFASRSALLWLIDGGYHTVQFLLFGLILGLWH